MFWLKQTVEVFETHPHSESPPVVEEVFHGLPQRRGGIAIGWVRIVSRSRAGTKQSWSPPDTTFEGVS